MSILEEPEMAVSGAKTPEPAAFPLTLISVIRLAGRFVHGFPVPLPSILVRRATFAIEIAAYGARQFDVLSRPHAHPAHTSST